MVLHLKKEDNKKDGLAVLEAQNRRIASIVETISNEIKQTTLKQHKENLSTSLTSKRMGMNSFGNTVSQAMLVHQKPAVPHKYSLISDDYQKHGYTRVHIPPDAIDWEVSLDFYDPPEFTDETVSTDEPLYPDNIQFNNDDGQINRLSYYKSYYLDCTDPLNCRGRTGLKGRGVFPRWGPNHYHMTIVTRLVYFMSSYKLLFYLYIFYLYIFYLYIFYLYIFYLYLYIYYSSQIFIGV